MNEGRPPPTPGETGGQRTTGRLVLGILRIAFGLLVLAAIAYIISVLVDLGRFNALNFFSFFTILSNLLAAGVFLEGGRRLVFRRKTLAAEWRGAAVVYMSVTYIVFAILLRNEQEALQTNVAWVDSVLHRVMPIALMVDWLIAPPRSPISFKRALLWMAFPVAYAAFTLVRGAIDGRYPYPFLDPANGGYGMVALYSVAILLLMLAVTWVVAWAGRVLGRRRLAAVR